MSIRTIKKKDTASRGDIAVVLMTDSFTYAYFHRCLGGSLSFTHTFLTFLRTTQHANNWKQNELILSAKSY